MDWHRVKSIGDSEDYKYPEEWEHGDTQPESDIEVIPSAPAQMRREEAADYNVFPGGEIHLKHSSFAQLNERYKANGEYGDWINRANAQNKPILIPTHKGSEFARFLI